MLAAAAGPALGARQLDAEAGTQLALSAIRDGVDALVRRHLVEEVGLRGFISTRDPTYLKPLGPPDPGYATRVAQLAEAMRAAGAGDAVPLLESLGATHAEWERRVALPFLRDPGRLDDYRLQITGRVLTDRLRTTGSRLRDVLSADRSRVEAQLRRTIALTVDISVGLITVLALAGLGLGVAREAAVARLARQRVLVDALQQTLRVGGARLPRTDLGFTYVSATTDALVGGDLLDSWRDGPESGWFLIADASGKGVQAARHAAFVQYAVRALAAEHADPAVVVGRFNQLFIDTFAEPSSFVVLFLGRFDGTTGELRYVGAGHSSAFIRNGTAVELLAPTGPIVGLEPASTFATQTVFLSVGSTVLLATDGLTEARDANGTFLGDDGVAALFAAAPGGPQAVCDFLVEASARWTGGRIADDLAILAVRVLDHEDGGTTAFSTMEAAPRR